MLPVPLSSTMAPCDACHVSTSATSSQQRTLSAAYAFDAAVETGGDLVAASACAIAAALIVPDDALSINDSSALAAFTAVALVLTAVGLGNGCADDDDIEPKMQRRHTTERTGGLGALASDTASWRDDETRRVREIKERPRTIDAQRRRRRAAAPFARRAALCRSTCRRCDCAAGEN